MNQITQAGEFRMPTADFSGQAPAQPQHWQESGLRRNFLEDLALKILFLHGEMLLRELATEMRLGLAVLEQIFQILRKEQLIEVKGMTAGNYHIAPSGQGKARALELLAISRYAGPAPVSLERYTQCVRGQSVQGVQVATEDVAKAFSRLVVNGETLDRIGTAVVSGTSIFLHGPTGTGKTSIAELIPDIYGDTAWIPYCLEVDNQIISIFDAAVHRPVAQPEADTYDSRWVRCRRPRVLVGGELTAEMIDLQFNPVSRFYSAPLQLKANNGVLVIDDLGRQRISPEELLNRWIVPLDRRIDHLTLAGGKTFEVPFDLFVVFSTNLDPAQLADEAFLRRIPNKIRIDHLKPAEFHEIARRVCAASSIEYEAAVVDHLITTISDELKQPLRACHPRDIVAQILWEARYHGSAPRFDHAAVERACRHYFIAAE